MANLKEIKSRITSVSSTMQITNAMKLVSAAKLKKAQDAITRVRPYAQKLEELLQNLTSNIEGEVGGAFTQQREVKKTLLVLVTSNRGLCGGFNSNIAKAARSFLKEENGQVDILSLGKKGADAMNPSGLKVDKKPEVVDPADYEVISALAEELMADFENEVYDRVVVIYNEFKNAASQIVRTQQLLPLQLPEADDNSASDYIFEPSKEEIILELIPKSIKLQLFKAVLDSVASEHGARMTAMHKATDNANDLKRELVLTYNQVRQAAITKEILEIVAGAEALDG